ncbi:hypothetical protein [Flavihumibacter petaseus]|uniref:Carbohydrate-binding family V/XII n=1 Tax=Flavihumibacter petaseus NBRC 106054 TaxID=1220578 RepID=A0A0E9MU64_9BACT|nr:hypothetical protein [Flavihumibacter petaseus]GAO41109.1 hypothetical protein FPE01S_01_01210 [Flavihumibacter petaseus NBRC 106054]
MFLVVVVLAMGIPLRQFAQTAGEDIGWPRQTKNSKGTLVYYQPQIKSWEKYTVLTADMAFSLTPAGGKETHGVATIACNTIVDQESHTVYLRNIDATSIRFPGLPEDQMQPMEDLFRQLAPTGGEPISLERLMADAEHKDLPNHTTELNNDPPKIFYSNTPAVVLTVTGDPVKAPVEKTHLEFVVNTNWDLFYETKEKQYYLLVNNFWLKSPQLESGWKVAATLPKEFSKLPAGQNFDEVKKMIPAPANRSNPPQIFFYDKPAELIILKGAPVYATVPGTGLLYITNTDNDIFLENTNKEFYVLFSGRWFSGSSLEGPWTYASDKLPPDFKKIPPKGDKARVLASVPGTVEASDAVLLAQVPTTAIVNKAQAVSQVKVQYDGDPQFKPIEGTSLEYASNTQQKIVKVGDMYYLCFQAVWFMSAKPNGPWQVADTVPDEIYKIPPSSPLYNVTYVTQTNATETTIESSTTAGYFGMFVVGMAVGACIAYGTGWFYPPYMWWGPGFMYPVYRPWPCTYGVGAVYNPWTGGWAAGRSVYGPYGAAGTSAWYNPATGRYGRSASVQGWYGGRTAASSYNPWTGSYAATRQGHNPYAQWGSSVATRGNQWAQTGHITNANGTTAGYRTSTGQSGVVHHGNNGTIAKGSNGTYVGHDGNIYRKNDNGSWSHYNNGSWQQNVGGDGSTRKSLDNSFNSRQRGNFQTRNFQNFRRGGGGGRMGGGFHRR